MRSINVLYCVLQLDCLLNYNTNNRKPTRRKIMTSHDTMNNIQTSHVMNNFNKIMHSLCR